MSVRQALTLGGYVVGAMFGAPQLGFIIGSIVGGIVDPIKTYGPKLSDSKIQTARDGVPINWGAGRFRCAGTIIAVQPGPPTEHEEEEGGKGGGQVSVTYTYTRTHAILVCEGPIIGIRRIWRDQKLVYDMSEEPTEAYGDLSIPELVSAWKAGLAASTAFAEGITIYLGDESQLPDPELEALFGVGNVPAHRGTAYVVFKDDDVTERGGSISNYEFEVVKAGTLSTYVEPPPSDFMTDDVLWHSFDNDYSADQAGTGGWINYFSVGYAGVDGVKDDAAQLANPMRDGGILTGPDWSMGAIFIGPNFNSDLTYFGRGTGAAFATAITCGFYLSTDAFGAVTGMAFHYDPIAPGNFVTEAFTVPGAPFLAFVTWQDGVGAGAGTFKVWINGVAKATLNPSAPTDYGMGTFFKSGGGAGQTIAWNLDEQATWPDRALTQAELLYLYNGGTFRNYLEALTGESSGGAEGNVPGAPGWEVDEEGNYVRVGASFDLVAPAPVTLEGFLAEICERSNVSADDYETGAIPDDIDGFLVARETDGGALVTILSQGFFFDAAEWDGKIRFVPRGGASVASLDADDLCLLEGPPVVETRDQEVERPRKINVSYFDPDLFYIPTKQTAERRTATISAIGEKTIELPIVFGRDTAAQVADKLIKVAWTDLLGGVEFALPDAFSYLVPTDVVTLSYRGRTQRLRIEKVDDDNGRLMITARQDRLSAYDSSATGIGTPLNPPFPTPLTATVFMAMNLPALRSGDDTAGIYLVACGTFPGWPGCVVQISYDGGASYSTLVTIRNASVIGTLASAASDPGMSPVSEAFSVDVYGEIASVTPTQIAAGANAFAIVDDNDVAEIGQVQTVAAASGTGEYDLLDPTRGQLETVAAAHAAGERFTMLDQALFVPIDAAYAGTTLYFRPVTIGTVAENNSVYTLVFDPGDIVLDGGEIT